MTIREAQVRGSLGKVDAKRQVHRAPQHWSPDLKETQEGRRTRKSYNMKQRHQSLGHSRIITRIATLNVYSTTNKLTAKKQYRNGNRVNFLVSTGTNIQEGGYKDISLEGMTRVGAICMEKGHIKGGVAIFAGDDIPRYEDYSIVTRRKTKQGTVLP